MRAGLSGNVLHAFPPSLGTGARHAGIARVCACTRCKHRVACLRSSSYPGQRRTAVCEAPRRCGARWLPLAVVTRWGAGAAVAALAAVVLWLLTLSSNLARQPTSFPQPTQMMRGMTALVRGSGARCVLPRAELCGQGEFDYIPKQWFWWVAPQRGFASSQERLRRRHPVKEVKADKQTGEREARCARVDAESVRGSGWSRRSKRTGVIARKIGMSTDWNEWGARLPLTYVQLEQVQGVCCFRAFACLPAEMPAAVVAHKTEKTHGYNAVQIGATDAKEKQLSVENACNWPGLSRRPAPRAQREEAAAGPLCQGRRAAQAPPLRVQVRGFALCGHCEVALLTLAMVQGHARCVSAPWC